MSLFPIYIYISYIYIFGSIQFTPDKSTSKSSSRDDSCEQIGAKTPKPRNSRVKDQLRNVQQIQATSCAFAAILVTGHVVTWGNAVSGGYSNHVQDQLRLGSVWYFFGGLMLMSSIICECCVFLKLCWCIVFLCQCLVGPSHNKSKVW